VSVAREHLPLFLTRARERGVPAREIGATGSARICVSIEGSRALDIAVSDAQTIWDTALEKFFKQRAA
jgi:hypothetical protein